MSKETTQAETPAPLSHVVGWTQADAERENSAFTKWFKERRYPDYPDLYPLTAENAMHSAWQEAAKRTALAGAQYVHIGYQWRGRAGPDDLWSPWRDGPCPAIAPKGAETEERRVYALVTAAEGSAE